MASYHEVDQQWHSGEEQMHKRLRVPDQDNPTSPYLTSYGNMILTRSPLVALGTLDKDGRPWTTIWGGEPGFSRAIGQSIIGVKATVDGRYDPVVEALLGKDADGEVVHPEGPRNMVGGLGIDLESRTRVKLYGRMVAGAVNATEGDASEAQLVVKIEQSLGNCPKYLNKKNIMPSIPVPRLVSDSLPLPQGAIDLVEKADMFFISSSNHESDMDTNHRGGPSGFVRILSNDENDCTLVYPEYSGNRLYQTLGNLTTTPKAGVVFPDYGAGDVLYLTGTTEILVGAAANDLLPRSNMVVKIKVEATRYVEKGLAFRGTPGEPSPYNPLVRLLPKEEIHKIPDSNKQIRASLVERKILTPTISRFRFHIDDPENASRWKPGQYVALSFEDELSIGYSHMRDNDPKSLNDDYLRTFTVSSGPEEASASAYGQFDITIRKVGRVTEYLFRHNIRSNLEVPLKGFGGEFIFKQDPREQIACVAGGIGITPLLAQASVLDLSRLHLYWTIRIEDLGLVLDTFERFPSLVDCTMLFVTGPEPMGTSLEKLKGLHSTACMRRMERADLKLEAEDGTEIKKWYVCTGDALHKTLLEWLKGRLVISEAFNY